jgi:hypothetical protein
VAAASSRNGFAGSALRLLAARGAEAKDAPRDTGREAAVDALRQMGFERALATRALEQNGWDVARSVARLLDGAPPA